MARTVKKKTAKKSARAAASSTKRRTAKKQATPSFAATMAKEITATILDGVGMTAKVSSALAAENVNILASTGYSASGFRRMATFTFIVDDLVKAEKALDDIGCENIQDQPIIMVETENKPGALERVAKIIGDAGIAIYYYYATTSSGKTATSVIKTADDKKAIKVLNRS